MSMALSVKSRLYQTIELIPEGELPVILSVAQKFVPDDIDDIASIDDLRAHELAVKDYMAGEAVDMADMDWN